MTPPQSRLFAGAPLAETLAAGLTTETSTRLWARIRRPDRLTLSLAAAAGSGGAMVPVGSWAVEPDADEGHDGAFALAFPADVPGAAPLRPSTRYEARLQHATGALVGVARFETAPPSPAEAPDRFTLAALSCHQPFDDEGRLRPDAAEMLTAAGRAFAAFDVKRALFMGDQMYADAPAPLSLFARGFLPGGPEALLRLAPAEVRALYQERHRIFWGPPGFRTLAAACASTATPDDHEIVDDFGSRAGHATAPWQAVKEAALDAFHDYGGLRALPRGPGGLRPPTFEHSLRYGPVGLFVTDLRSNRAPGAAESRVLAPDQFAALERFLNEAGAAGLAVAVIVVSVPLVYLPDAVTVAGERLLGSESEFGDRWSASRHRAERDRLLGLLAAHAAAFPKQRLVVLSGDVHAGCAARLEVPGAPGVAIHQFVSSAFTNAGDGGLRARLARRSIHLTPLGAPAGLEASFLRGLTPDVDENPCVRLNLGLLEIARAAPDFSAATIRFRLVSHAGDEPLVVYDSGPL